MRRILILLATHLLTLGLGFGLGVYLLPILIAPDDPPVAQVQAAMKDAPYRTTFRRDLKGSDAVHWAEGNVSVSCCGGSLGVTASLGNRASAMSTMTNKSSAFCVDRWSSSSLSSRSFVGW